MHVMGQIMTEAVLADQGANTVNAGSHMPINEMVGAAAAFRADVLALSISLADHAIELIASVGTVNLPRCARVVRDS